MSSHTLGVLASAFCFLPSFMSYLIWKAGEDAFESYIEMGYTVILALFGVCILIVEFVL